MKSEKGSSGNAPAGSFQSCEALKQNPVYSRNQCDVLKGPNKGLVWGGVSAAAAGIALIAIGSARTSVEFDAGGVGFHHRLSW